MRAETLAGGFTEPAIQSAQAFRAVMEAMARPGTIHTITGAQPPAPISPAAGSVLLTLCDTDTPIHLAGSADTEETRAWLAFHTGAPLASAATCAFALGTWEALQPLNRYPVGTTRYPDRSATLIIETPALTTTGASLTGPGIKDTARLSLPETRAFEENHRLFPRGLDFILTSGTQLAALPRTTTVSEAS